MKMNQNWIKIKHVNVTKANIYIILMLYLITLIRHLQLVTTNNNNSSQTYTVYSSLQHALSLLSQLCLHQ
jgi:hypothetical protein